MKILVNLKAYLLRLWSRTQAMGNSITTSKAGIKTKRGLIRLFALDRGDFEKSAIRIVLVGGLILAVGILFLEKGGSGGEGGHGHGEEEGHEEHGGHDEHGEEQPNVEISEEAIEASEIGVEVAKSRDIKKIIKLRGQITVNRDKYVEIAPRYPGTIVRIFKRLGDEVKKGEVLASVESVTVRTVFDVRSGIDGTVVGRQSLPGSFASEREPIYTIVDLSTVWAEFSAPDTDFGTIRTGQKIKIKSGDLDVETTVFYVSSHVNEDTQTLLVRALIDNQSRKWLPGSFAEADLYTEESRAKVAVHRDAIQMLDEKPVVFVQDEERFVVREVSLGAVGSKWTEITEGVAEGENYVSQNSFVLKSELLKSTAEHVH